MEVVITGNDDLDYKKVEMNTDHRLDTDYLRFPYAFHSPTKPERNSPAVQK